MNWLHPDGFTADRHAALARLRRPRRLPARRRRRRQRRSCGELATRPPSRAPTGARTSSRCARVCATPTARRSGPSDFRASMERMLRRHRAGSAVLRRDRGRARLLRGPRTATCRAGIGRPTATRTITLHLTRAGSGVPALADARLRLRRAGRHASTAAGCRPGTGPYRIARWDPKRAGCSSATRTSGPARRPAGFAERIEVAFTPPAAVESQIAAVDRGEADAVVLAEPFRSFVSSARLRALAARSPARMHGLLNAVTEWMFLNVARPPFDDIRVRRAVNLAADRAALVDSLASRGRPPRPARWSPPRSPASRPTVRTPPGGRRQRVDRLRTSGSRAPPRRRVRHGRYDGGRRGPGAVAAPRWAPTSCHCCTTSDSGRGCTRCLTVGAYFPQHLPPRLPRADGLGWLGARTT